MQQMKQLFPGILKLRFQVVQISLFQEEGRFPAKCDPDVHQRGFRPRPFWDFCR